MFPKEVAVGRCKVGSYLPKTGKREEDKEEPDESRDCAKSAFYLWSHKVNNNPHSYEHIKIDSFLKRLMDSWSGHIL